MKILMIFVASLFLIAFILLIVGYIDDNLAIKKVCGKLSSALVAVALLMSFYGSVDATLSLVVSTGEGKFKTVTNNEVRYFNKCKKEKGHNICRADSGKEVAVDDYWKNEETK